MKLPIHIHIGEGTDAVEAKWRKSIRKDFGIRRNIQSLGLMFYEHPSGAVGVLYEAQFLVRADEYTAALNAFGFKLKRSVRVPTVHATLRIAL